MEYYKLKGKYKSIIQADESCIACGKSYELDCHHIFNSYNKKRSEKYGMMVYLCRTCHSEVHDTRSPLRRRIEAHAQDVWEHTYGTREEFIKEFNKSYAL